MTQTPTLKIRFAIAMSIGALLLVVTMGVVTLHYAEADLQASLYSQQDTLVKRAAEDLDDKLKLAMDSLTASANAMPIDVIASQEQFEAFHTARPSLLTLFDSLVIVNARGVVAAGVPKRGLNNVDLSDRPYVQRILKTGQPTISEPVVSRITGVSLVTLGTPILDTDGRVVAILFGTLHLGRSNILGDLGETRLGVGGYFTVISTDLKPVYLVHPDRALVMKPVAVDRSPAMAAVLASTGRGVADSVLEDGSRVIVSFQRLSVSNWVLAAVMPREEAFALIDHARNRIIRTAVISALAVLPLVWLFAWKMLQPLSALREQVEAVSRGDYAELRVPEGRADEVGLVARAFNVMRQAQHESETMRAASDRDRRRLVAILESSNDYVAMTDTAGFLSYINASGRRIRGIGLNDEVGRTTIRDYFPAWAVDKIERHAVPSALKSGIWTGQSAVLDHIGNEIPVDHTVIAHRNVEGRVEFFSSLMHDISDARAATVAMRSSEARMLAIADASPVLVSFIDRDYRYRFINSRYEDHFGLARDEMLGKSVLELIGTVAFERYRPYLEAAATGETQLFEFESSAGLKPAHFSVKLIPQFDDEQRLLGYHFFHQDVTHHKIEQRRLSDLARSDALTGLMNRAGFDLAIAEARTRSNALECAMALFYLDIDRFKSVNDNHGHSTGDALLKAFSERLVRAVRTTDVVARLGGDEFVVIAEQLRSADDVRAVAGKIVGAMRPAFELPGITLSITTSVGVAVLVGREDGSTIPVSELIERADAALYRAKKNGRNTCELDDASLPLVAATRPERRLTAEIREDALV